MARAVPLRGSRFLVRRGSAFFVRHRGHDEFLLANYGRRYSAEPLLPFRGLWIFQQFALPNLPRSFVWDSQALSRID